MMRTTFGLILWGALGLWSAAACAADPWQNCQIMPKSDRLLLRVGGQVTGNVYQIPWPAAVQHIEGQWLWISDDGGYDVPAISGWVSKDEVLKVDEAQKYYLGLLQTCDAPWLHWLIGICLEEKRESTSAQEEYLRCLELRLDPSDADAVRRALPGAVAGEPNLLDAAVRLLRSQSSTAKSAEDAAAAANALRDLAQTADTAGLRRPQVLFEAGEALRKAFGLKVAEERQAPR